jgi:hypothetical protein
LCRLSIVEQSAIKELSEKLVSFNSELQKEFPKADHMGTGEQGIWVISIHVKGQTKRGRKKEEWKQGWT